MRPAQLDIVNELKTAYYSALNGNISVDVYDGVVPKGAINFNANSFKYVLIGENTYISESNKTAHLMNNTILLDVVTGYHQFPGTKPNNDIVEEIMPLIYPASNNYLTMTNFKLVTTEIISNETLLETTETHTIARRLIRIRNLIQQKL